VANQSKNNIHLSELMRSLQLIVFSSLQTNTFQCIITSNGEKSYVFFFYADGLIQWANPFITIDENFAFPLAGINAGDLLMYESVAGSRTSAIANIDTTSNVGMGGVWAFRMDTMETPMQPCDNQSKLEI